MTAVPTIYVDFQNADPSGRVRLNTTGSLHDLAALPDGPTDGLTVQLEAEDLRASGILRFSADEQIWVAELDWSQVEER